MSTTIEDLVTAATAPKTDTTDDTATPGLGADVQKHIGNLLKVSFQDLLTEPVPDRFSQLLEQLEQAEKNKVK
jgi:Anti-sigma factor NepR